MAEEYNTELQKLFLEFLVSDHELFIRCNSILDENYFDRAVRDSVKFVREYVDEYGMVPERKQIQAKTGLELQDLGKAGEEHRKWFLDDFEKFCRYKALEIAILQSTDKLERKEYGAVEELIKNAVQIGLAKELGTNYWEDPARKWTARGIALLSLALWILVATAGCFRGIQCGRSASAVGFAATSSMVTSIVLIVVADAIITIACQILEL